MADLNDISLGLATLEEGRVFRVANEAVPADSYLFNQFLPERNEPDYSVDSGSRLIIRATMADLVGMDSPYPEGGAIEESSFAEQTAKIANRVRLPEAAIRKLQTILLRQRANGQATVQTVTDTFLNFVDKLIVQPHLDTAEWLRGRALIDHKLDWICGRKRLEVDYQLKAGSRLPDLTGANAFSGATSQFWPTMLAMRRYLNNNVRAFVVDPQLMDAIISNPAHNLEIVDEEELNRNVSAVTVQRVVGTTERLDRDTRYRIRLISYAKEADVLDRRSRTGTKTVPFMYPGEMFAIGNNENTAFEIGEGGTPDRDSNNVGYTHIAPTTESGGVMGRWADAYQPERERWAFEGVGVSNILPVLEADDKLISVKNVLS